MSAVSHTSLPLFIGLALMCGTAGALEDLDHNKSGAKLFADNCANCHRNPRDLAKHQFSWTLSYFLREHYTSSPESAQALTAYLQSVDAARIKAQPATMPIEVPQMMTGLMSWASKIARASSTGPTPRKMRPTQRSAAVPLPPPRPTLVPKRTPGNEASHAPVAPIPD